MSRVLKVTHHLFESYDDHGPAYDEMFDRQTPRESYARLHDAFGELSARDLEARAEGLQNSYLDQGVTFDIGGEERAFPIDIVPRVIEQENWSQIDLGVQQRVKALEMFLADIYGPGEAFRDGVIPRSVVTTSSHYHRQTYGIEPPNGVREHEEGGRGVVDDEDLHGACTPANVSNEAARRSSFE